MPNPENLIPHKFKKGQSGNPKGRPKKLPELDEIMGEVLGTETAGKTAAMHIISALVRRAKRGDVKAAELLLNRAYGKTKEQIESKIQISTPFSPDQVDMILYEIRSRKQHQEES